MQKWEYARINSGKTIIENWRRDSRDLNFVIPGKMNVWVVVFYYHNTTSPVLLYSQDMDFDPTRPEVIRSFRIALTERALGKLGLEGWESYSTYMDEDAVPVFFMKRPLPEPPYK